jgi:hypothetical protein
LVKLTEGAPQPKLQKVADKNTDDPASTAPASPKDDVNRQSTSANNGNTSAAQANNNSRPTWQQSENDIVTSDYEKQVAFKNKRVVPMNKKGSVRPEGYKIGETIEVKNYDLRTEAGIKSMIANVVKQFRRRVSNLPSGTKQNIVLDVRGQSLNTNQLMKIKSRLMTQTGTRNVSINFKID